MLGLAPLPKLDFMRSYAASFLALSASRARPMALKPSRSPLSSAAAWAASAPMPSPMSFNASQVEAAAKAMPSRISANTCPACGPSWLMKLPMRVNTGSSALPNCISMLLPTSPRSRICALYCLLMATPSGPTIRPSWRARTSLSAICAVVSFKMPRISAQPLPYTCWPAMFCSIGFLISISFWFTSPISSVTGR